MLIGSCFGLQSDLLPSPASIILYFTKAIIFLEYLALIKALESTALITSLQVSHSTCIPMMDTQRSSSNQTARLHGPGFH